MRRSQHTWRRPRMARVGRATRPNGHCVRCWVPLQRHRSPGPWRLTLLRTRKGMPFILVDAPYSRIPHLQFTHLLRLFVTLKSIAVTLSWSHADTCTVAKKNLRPLWGTGPQLSRNKATVCLLSSRFGSHRVDECLFGGLASVTFVAFFCFSLMILLF